VFGAGILEGCITSAHWHELQTVRKIVNVNFYIRFIKLWMAPFVTVSCLLFWGQIKYFSTVSLSAVLISQLLDECFTFAWLSELSLRFEN